MQKMINFDDVTKENIKEHNPSWPHIPEHPYRLFRVQFNHLWFVFHDSSWSFHEPYFSRKHTFHESFEWTEHKIMILKPANKYQIIRQQWFTLLSIFLSNKSFGNIIFYRAEITNWKDETINCSNIYLLFDLLWCKKTFRKIIQLKEIYFAL